jgi:rod shape-determining protein MreC
VQIVRNGQRSVVFGLGNGQLELRFMPANADMSRSATCWSLRVSTASFCPASGRQGGAISSATPRIRSRASICVPVAGVENFGEVMVLDPREPVAAPQLTEARLMAQAAASRARQEKTREEGIDSMQPTFSRRASCNRFGRGSS